MLFLDFEFLSFFRESDRLELSTNLFLDLDQLLLHGGGAGGVDGARQGGEALLLENLIDLAVLAADVEEQGVFLLEDVVADGALEAVHEAGVLLLQVVGQG